MAERNAVLLMYSLFSAVAMVVVVSITDLTTVFGTNLPIFLVYFWNVSCSRCYWSCCFFLCDCCCSHCCCIFFVLVAAYPSVCNWLVYFGFIMSSKICWLFKAFNLSQLGWFSFHDPVVQSNIRCKIFFWRSLILVLNISICRTVMDTNKDLGPSVPRASAPIAGETTRFEYPVAVKVWESHDEHPLRAVISSTYTYYIPPMPVKSLACASSVHRL